MHSDTSLCLQNSHMLKTVVKFQLMINCSQNMISPAKSRHSEITPYFRRKSIFWRLYFLTQKLHA